MEHHVYFWLTEEGKNTANRAAFEQGLADLFKIPLVGGGRWSVPAKVELRPVVDQSWDYALSMTFATLADHDAYQAAPAHHDFINSFKHLWGKVMVMDLA